MHQIMNQGNLFLNVLCREQKAFQWWSQRLRRVKTIYILDQSILPLINTISQYRDSFAYLRHIVLDFTLLVNLEKQFPNILNYYPMLILRLNENAPKKHLCKSNYEEFFKNIKALETITRVTNKEEWKPRRKRIIAAEFINFSLHFYLESKTWTTKNSLNDINIQRLKFLFLELCSHVKQKKVLKILNARDCVSTCFFLFELNIDFQLVDKEYQELTKRIFADCIEKMIKTILKALKKEENNVNINMNIFHYHLTSKIETYIESFLKKVNYSLQVEMVCCVLEKIYSLSHLEGSYLLFFLIVIDRGIILKFILQDVLSKQPCTYAKTGCLFKPDCRNGLISTITTIRDWLVTSSCICKTLLEKCLSNFLLSLSTGLEEKGKKIIYDSTIVTRAQKQYQDFKSELNQTVSLLNELKEKYSHEEKETTEIKKEWFDDKFQYCNMEEPKFVLKKLDGRKIQLNFKCFRTVKDLREWAKTYYELGEIKLCHRGTYLLDTEFLIEKITPNDVIHMIQQVRGDIGIFIMKNQKKKYSSPIQKHLEEQENSNEEFLSTLSNANLTFPPGPATFFSSELKIMFLLSTTQCLKVIQFCESKINQKDKDAKEYQLVLQEKDLFSCLGKWSIQKIRKVIPDFNIIKYRRLQREDQAFIPFHRDESKQTLQIFLNSRTEYKGASTTFCVAPTFLCPTNLGTKKILLDYPMIQLFTPRRKQGWGTLHNDQVWHGVSPMRHGVRQSLFFCVAPAHPTSLIL